MTTQRASTAPIGLRLKKDGTVQPSAAEIAANVNALLTRSNNDHSSVIAQLLGEAHKHREDKRKLREEIDLLKTKTPPEGARVLSKEEAGDYEAYLQLGKPADVKKSLEGLSELQEKVRKFEREGAVREAAEALGYNHSVLEKLLEGEIEMREIEVQDSQGNKSSKKAPYVKTADGVVTLLKDHAEACWSDFMPSLANQARTNDSAQAVGVQYGAAGNGQPAPKGQAGILDSFLADREKRNSGLTNPLVAKP